MTDIDLTKLEQLLDSMRAASPEAVQDARSFMTSTDVDLEDSPCDDAAFLEAVASNAALLHAVKIRAAELAVTTLDPTQDPRPLLDELRHYVRDAAYCEPREDFSYEDGRAGPELLAKIHEALGLPPPGPIGHIDDE